MFVIWQSISQALKNFWNGQIHNNTPLITNHIISNLSHNIKSHIKCLHIEDLVRCWDIYRHQPRPETNYKCRLMSCNICVFLIVTQDYTSRGKVPSPCKTSEESALFLWYWLIQTDLIITSHSHGFFPISLLFFLLLLNKFILIALQRHNYSL